MAAFAISVWRPDRRSWSALFAGTLGVLAGAYLIQSDRITELTFAGWGTMKAKERVAADVEEVARLKKQIEQHAAEIRAAAASLTGVGQRVEAAERQLNRYFPENPRRLSDDERATLRKNLKKPPHRLFIFADPLGGAPEFARSFAELFKEIGLDQLDVAHWPCGGRSSGVVVGLKHPDAMSEPARAFIGALADAGLKPQTTLWQLPDFPESLDFMLWICPPAK